MYNKSTICGHKYSHTLYQILPMNLKNTKTIYNRFAHHTLFRNTFADILIDSYFFGLAQIKTQNNIVFCLPTIDNRGHNYEKISFK